MAEAHPLMLYNTLTRRKEAFEPLDPGNVRMYVCGPTVYDYAHIGNARPVIVFDVLFRLLRHLYGAGHVTYVRNITDVDDKINARAAEEGVSIRELTERTAQQFHQDIEALGVLPPTVEPRATEHIAEMKVLIEALVANGHAYVAENHVLFDVPSMPDYGRLSNRSLEEMEAGARVEVAPYKKDPMDFVLWKPSKTVGGAVGEKQAEPAWPSPAGITVHGRPGWHIECSAMAEKHLGSVFDIHGGGIDLVFPHHENEIAQSRCAHGTPVMARYWLHNGYLQVEGEKMSKSLGNFITIHELLATRKFGGRTWPGNVIRLCMLETHYRQPIDWTAEKVNRAAHDLLRFTSGFFSMIASHFNNDLARAADYVATHQQEVPDEIIEALSDDLNTPLAINLLRRSFGEMERAPSKAMEVLAGLSFLGIIRPTAPMLNHTPAVFGVYDTDETMATFAQGVEFVTALINYNSERVDEITSDLAAKEIRVVPYPLGMFLLERKNVKSNAQERMIAEMVAARSEARKKKDFKESDRIRDELAAMGVALKDAKDPNTGEITTTWEVRAPSTTEVSR
jgi:cysteinyl-tRNA synthetase